MTRRRAPGILWTALLLATLPAPSLAGTWNAGVRAGLNLANLRGDLADDMRTRSTLGAHAGVFVEHAFSDRFALDFELLYSARGAAFDAPIMDEFGKIIGLDTDRFRINYLEVPALATVSFPFSSAVRARVLAGPVFGVSLGGRFESNSDPARSRDLDGVRAIDIGVAGGAGLGFEASTYAIIVDARYTAGLLDSFEFGSAAGAMHQVISMGLAVKWRFPSPQKG